MNRLASLALLTAVGALAAAPVPTTIPDTPATDPAKFLPTRAYTARDGTVVGVLVADAGPVMSRDGRSSQADAIAFSRDGGSYNWLYVPVEANPQITNLQVRVGPKGGTTVVYAKLSMASPKTTAAWVVSEKFTLAEVTVNDGQGAPADEAFVASGVKVVEGTKAYPVKANEVVTTAREQFAKYSTAIKKDLSDAMAKSQKAALNDEAPSGKVKTEELLHVTWLPADEQLAVTFLVKQSDGAWKKGGGGANLDDGLRDPPALPVKPGGGGAQIAPPPPRDDTGVTWGTGFGVEYGRTFVYGKDGKLVKTVTLAPTAFKLDLPPPAVRGKFFPLPVPPVADPPPPVKKESETSPPVPHTHGRGGVQLHKWPIFAATEGGANVGDPFGRGEKCRRFQH